ncbi:hypothetical protein ACI2OX_10615 [Bacillus sp. N9]
MEVIVVIMFSLGMIVLGCYMFCQAFSNHLIQERLFFTNYPKGFGAFTIFLFPTFIVGAFIHL